MKITQIPFIKHIGIEKLDNKTLIYSTNPSFDNLNLKHHDQQ
jgi:hypothetical protein